MKFRNAWPRRIIVPRQGEGCFPCCYSSDFTEPSSVVVDNSYGKGYPQYVRTSQGHNDHVCIYIINFKKSGDFLLWS